MEIIAGHRYQPLVHLELQSIAFRRKGAFFVRGSRVRPWRWVLKAGSFLVTTSVVKSALPCRASVSELRMEPEEALDWSARNYL